MQPCKKCGGKIPTNLYIDGREQKVSSHRVYCFTCSPEGSHNTRILSVSEINKCKRCGAPTKTVKLCASCRVTLWRQRRKLDAIEYLGGKCASCGFDKYVSSMDFHHVDAPKKDFSLSGRTIAWDRMKQELDKCVLLCSNCHRAVHSEELDLPKGI